MKAKQKRPNFIILIIVGLLFLLLILILTLLTILQNSEGSTQTGNITVDTNTVVTSGKAKTVKEVIESYGSEYIDREKSVFTKIYVKFQHDLFDENGKSKKQYFYDMIEDIVKIEKDSFYLIDNDKKIEIYVAYDKDKETYNIKINNIEDYYDNTDGEIYVSLNEAEIGKRGSFSLKNNLIQNIAGNNMYYARTELASEDRVDLGNGYYSYQDGEIIARLQSGRALNVLFTEKYENTIGLNTYVDTPLEDVYEKYSDNAFGSVRDGYLGYRLSNSYIFLYEDEVSVYGYQYSANTYFDTYLKDYCETGDLEKLYKDFTTEWTNYFEKEYNPETQSVRITFPTRGIEIDIEGNDSKGIKIYNNYYLTDTVKELIKSHKITLVSNKDLIHITEQARREGSR